MMNSMESFEEPFDKKGGTFVPALCSVFGTLILLGVIAVFLPLTIPRFMGYEIYEVVSGSMEPEIPVGSILYVEATPPEEIEPGDVIAFMKDGSVVTHRVEENRYVEGEFITKGDANAENDMEPVPYAAMLGRMVVSVPVLGTVMAVCSGSMGKAYLAGGVAGALFLQLLAGMLRKEGREQ